MDNITAKQTEHGDYAYGYDDLYRLTSTDNPVQDDEAFTYDAVGNRLTAADTTGNWTYNSNNELGGYDNVSYVYDDNGNMVQKTDNGIVTNYYYNIEDRLERVEDGSGSLISTYFYDPFGRRLWKEVGGVRTYFFYADEGLVAEVDAAGNVVKSYGYRPNSTWTTDPLFMKVGGQYYFYQNDHLGTPQKMTAANGAVVWSAKYSAFGEAEVDSSSSITNNLRFPGQYLDVESGLYYNFHRYYDPGIGRYLRNDPSFYLHPAIKQISFFVFDMLFEPLELNLFAYAQNKVIIKKDERGLVTIGSTCSNPAQIRALIPQVENKINSNCIPESMKSCLRRKLSKMNVECWQDASTVDCGFSIPCVGTGIKINDGRSVCVSAGTIFHELLHKCCNDEDQAYGCEEKCFPGTTQGRGKPCDCKPHKPPTPEPR